MIAAPTTAHSSPGERVRDECSIFRVDRMIDCGQQVLVAQAWAGLQPLIKADENWLRAGGALLITVISPPVE